MAPEEEVKKGFPNEEGPFVGCLDLALQSFNVHRQAYYGGTFVGNHIHRSLKVHVLHIQEVYVHMYYMYIIGTEH